MIDDQLMYAGSAVVSMDIVSTVMCSCKDMIMVTFSLLDTSVKKEVYKLQLFRFIY